MNKAFSLAILASLMLAVACGPSMINGSDIEDNPANREIYEMVETYRVAMEKRDVDTLAAMLSSSYFENASTTATGTDDYGYEALQDTVLPLLRDHIKALQLRIRLTRIEVEGDRAYADYEFWMKFLYADGGQEGWRVKNDFNRLEFVREGDAWKIAGGL